MRYLILSDIHGNWEALEAVLGEAAGAYEAALCCGDLVGYGADPNRVVDWARESAEVVVRGNHDKACAGLDDLDWFNPVARAAALWTGATLRAENLEYLRSLPKGPVPVCSFQILHGSPLDEDEYLLSNTGVMQVAPYLATAVSFFGHTHLQGGFLCHPSGVKHIPKPALAAKHRVLGIDPGACYLFNPGSVGQPRDRDPRAAYILYDPEGQSLEFRRVQYDVKAAQARIREAGLPDLLAERLEFGT